MEFYGQRPIFESHWRFFEGVITLNRCRTKEEFWYIYVTRIRGPKVNSTSVVPAYDIIYKTDMNREKTLLGSFLQILFLESP